MYMYELKQLTTQLLFTQEMQQINVHAYPNHSWGIPRGSLP